MRGERGLAAVTEDAALGGRLRLLQPHSGHRFGHDAILLAAAIAARSGDHVVDLGAGVGAAGLALAARVTGVRVTLVDIDAHLMGLARRNICLNGFEHRIRAVSLDVAAPTSAFSAAGLKSGSAAQVMMNPPFNDPVRQNRSPEVARARAHTASQDTLAIWTKTAARLLAPKGVLTLIWRADGLADVLAALERGFGGISVCPVHARPSAAAIRILVRALKASNTPLVLAPAFYLSDESGKVTAAAEAVLREGASLPLA